MVAQVDEGQVLAVLAPASRPSRRRATVPADVVGVAARRTSRCACTSLQSRSLSSVTVAMRVDHGSARRPVDLLARTAGPAPSTVPAAASSLADDRRANARARLGRPPSSGPSSTGRRSARSARDAGSAQLGASRSWPRRRRCTSTTNTSTPARRAGNTPSASQASSTRSMPEPKPMPGVGGPPSCLGEPVVAPAAADAFWAASSASALRTRTWCACSSRARAPGGGVDLERDAERVAARPAPARSGRCDSSDEVLGDLRGASATTCRVSGRFESSTRSGLASTLLADSSPQARRRGRAK